MVSEAIAAAGREQSAKALYPLFTHSETSARPLHLHRTLDLLCMVGRHIEYYHVSDTIGILYLYRAIGPTSFKDT